MTAYSRCLGCSVCRSHSPCPVGDVDRPVCVICEERPASIACVWGETCIECRRCAECQSPMRDERPGERTCQDCDDLRIERARRDAHDEARDRAACAWVDERTGSR